MRKKQSFDPQTQTLLGDHSVEASAGTGKTYSITLLWLRLILEQEIRIEKILVSTFTKAATAELKDRLLETLKKARWLLTPKSQNDTSKDGKAHNETDSAIAKALQHAKDLHPNIKDEAWISKIDLAISSFDLAPIFTIHGFCDRLLRQNALELNCDPELELVPNNPGLIRRVVDDFLMQSSEFTGLSHDKALSIAETLIKEAAIDSDKILCCPGYNNEDFIRRKKIIEAQYHKHVGEWSINADKMLQNAIAGDYHEKLAKGEELNYFKKMTELSPNIVEELRAAASYAKSAEVGGRDFVDFIRTEYPKAQQEMGVKDYQDILLSIRSALRNDGQRKSLATAVREKYHAVIIDECQDSDAVQIEIFKCLFLEDEHKVKCFIVIGDPKQSIYRFRGADLFSYSQLTSLCTAAPEMKTNYRSDAALVEAINGLYGQNYHFEAPNPETKIEYVTVESKHPSRIIDPDYPDVPCCWMLSSSEDRQMAMRDLAKQTAFECLRLLAGKVEIFDRKGEQQRILLASDIAVLAHTSSQLKKVREALLQVGIPCQMMGKGIGSVFASDEALDVFAWLDLLAKLENDQGNLLKPLLLFASTPLSGNLYGARVHLQKDPYAVGAALQNIKSQLDNFKKYGPLPVFMRYINSEVNARILGHIGGERMVTNWRQLIQFMQEEWRVGHRTAASLVGILMSKMSSQVSQEEEMARLETDLPAVQLSTIHGSKGLEYPIVFCPYLWHVGSRTYKKSRKLIATLRKGAESQLDYQSQSMDESKEADLRQEDQEQQRLLYVALTRARHRLILGYADIAESAKGGCNSSLHSCLAKLPNVRFTGSGEQLAPSPSWPKVKLAKAKAKGAPKTSASAPELFKVPEVEAYRGTIIRRVSFSSLLQQNLGLSLSKNRDEEPEGIASPEIQAPPMNYGLIPKTLQGGPLLGNTIHDLLEQHLGNRIPLDQLFCTASKQNSEMRTVLENLLKGPIPLGEYGRASSLAHFAQNNISEMHFLMPMGSLTPKKLSSTLMELDIIRRKPERLEWAKGVENWSFDRCRGYLQGYIDLIVQFDQRWYVADYKTNLLSGYHESDCEAAMIHGHYLLQGLIYALALHRHLATNLRNYKVNQAIGGLAYLFVRGLFEGQGVWFDTPTEADLNKLDKCFDPEAL